MSTVKILVSTTWLRAVARQKSATDPDESYLALARRHAVATVIRPLFITTDAALLDDLLRLSAAAGVEPQVAPDLVAARSSWALAPLVIAGVDISPEPPVPPLARRSGVVVVGRIPADADTWRHAVLLGAEQVVSLPDAEPWLIDRIAEALEPEKPEAVTVCVQGGRGGAGASTLAAALAITGTRCGLSTMLLDADPLGGGIDLIVGGEGVAGTRWPELVATRGRLSGTSLRGALPELNSLLILSWDRGDLLAVPPEAMRAVLGAARRTCELVVVDVPRSLDAAAGETLNRSTVTLLVVPAEVRATASAARVAVSSKALCADVRVVVRGPAPGGLSAAAVAGALRLPLAGVLRPEPGLATTLDRGEVPGLGLRSPLARFCRSFLRGAVSGVPETTPS
jgi:secretion/DNA translocation related CpaE-like protein